MAEGYGYGAEGDAADRRADVGRSDDARRDAVHRDVRDGLPVGLDPDEPHGRGQLAPRARRPARAADQAAARHRRARRPADVPVPVRARARRRSRRSSRSAASASGCSSPRARCSTPTSCRRSRCRTGASARTPECAPAWTPGCGSAGRITRSSTRAARREAWRVVQRAGRCRVRRGLTRCPMGGAVMRRSCSCPSRFGCVRRALCAPCSSRPRRWAAAAERPSTATAASSVDRSRASGTLPPTRSGGTAIDRYTLSQPAA